jgi:hypothetical protein
VPLTTLLPVTVTPLYDYPALIMTWPRFIERNSIKEAFRTIVEALDESDVPLYIIVDLSANPDFPMTETIQGAYFGPFRHRLLAEWLVVNTNMLGRMIGNTLTSITRRHNIRWLDTMEDATAYLDEVGASVGSSIW